MIRNIPYGVHARQKLDIYYPASRRVALPSAASSALPLPVILFFYGGSWRWGEKSDYRFVAASLAKRGFMVVMPDYRLYPQAKFPVFLEDGAAASAWVFKNIHQHGGDDGAVFLMGHSAGAYNAMMLALDTRYLIAAGTDPARLAGVIGLAGPYDFLPFHDSAIARIFGGVEEKLTQPINYVREAAPPALLLHGGKDKMVWPRNTSMLSARLREVGATVETRIYPNLGHTDILLACLPYFVWRKQLLKDLLHFIEACRNGEFSDARSVVSAPML